jgi:hypothetical protein
MKAQVTYPVYRRYPHGNTWFKVLAEDQFEELQVLGKHFSLSMHQASILPDFNYINDLVHDYEPYWEPVTALQWDEKLRWCKANLTVLQP